MGARKKAHRVLNSHGDDANKQHDGVTGCTFQLARIKGYSSSREKFRPFFLFIISLNLYRRARLAASLLRNETC